eukprot:6767037-Pyramimonas_sp.AAC.1
MEGIGPSRIPRGLPPTAFKSPPSTRKARAAILRGELHANQLKTLLNQAHIVAEQLSAAQEDLMA